MESLLCAKHLVVHKTDKVPGVTALQAEGTGSAKALRWAWSSAEARLAGRMRDREKREG